MTRQFFVFIVDTYAQPSLLGALESIGLVRRETYDCDSYYYMGRLLAGDPGQRYVDAKHLLVFMSSYKGDIIPSVSFSEEIKKENPSATIIFRSTDVYGADEHKVFDGILQKHSENHTALLKIVQDCMQKAGVAIK